MAIIAIISEKTYLKQAEKGKQANPTSTRTNKSDYLPFVCFLSSFHQILMRQNLGTASSDAHTKKVLFFFLLSTLFSERSLYHRMTYQ